ncbi:MAG: 50S ribosomal protein L19 [Candidatus Omnitrophica bacterium]|nr:50S ribosomal protein L19 [Candidatus Omnitrophota bacterium]
MNLIEKVEAPHLKKDIPSFRVGDTLRVSFRVKEGEKTRTQLFEGICIRKRGRGLSAACTLLKESYGDKVEKTFPVHSPAVEKIVRVHGGKARKAKLYYLRHSH